MYGAVLRPHTELTATGEAHMGVLFLTNEGYSTMCGHATLALGRLLVDYSGAGKSNMGAFTAMNEISFDESRDETKVILHAPCGLVHIIVPTVHAPGGGWRTDTTRPVSYLSVPSYATGISVHLDLPAGDNTVRQALGDLKSVAKGVEIDIAYGGAFYIIVPVASLGLKSLQSAGLETLSTAARTLKAAFNAPDALDLRKKCLVHPEHRDLEFLYGIIITGPEAVGGAENGLCFFANEQVDRSPTGSGVQARVALACAKGQRGLNEPFVYHSPVSKAFEGEGAFVGEAVETVDVSGGLKGVIVKVSGSAKYTGHCSFMIEDGDMIGEGFWFDESISQKHQH